MNGHRPPNQPNGQPLYIGFDTPGDNAQEKANEAIGHAQAAAAQAQAAQAQANAAHAQAAQAHAAAAQAQANVHAAPPTPPPAAIYVPVHTGYQTRQNMVAQSNPDPGIHYPKKKRANFFGMLGTAVGVGAFAAPVAPVLITGAACSTLGLLFHRKWWAFAGLLLILCNPGTHRLIHHAMDPHGHHAREVKRESGRQLQRTNRSMDKAAELIEGSFVESGKWPADVDGNMILLEAKSQDAWGKAIRYDEMQRSLVLRSAGPDGRYETKDDVVHTLFQAPPGETISTTPLTL